MAKRMLALVLGIISFFLFFFIGEEVGLAAGFIGSGIYYFIAQFLLSRGNPVAPRNDWVVILCLNVAFIVTAILVLLIEPDTKWHAIVVVISLGCSILGAKFAALLAANS